MLSVQFGAVQSVVIVVLGASNFTDSGLNRWISMPFAASAMGGPSGEMDGGGASGEPGEEIVVVVPTAEPDPNPPVATPVSEVTPEPEVEEEPASSEMSQPQTSGEPTQSRASGEMGSPSSEMGGGVRIGRVLTLVWQFGSVVLAVMTVTGWVDVLCLWAKGRIRAGKKAKPQEE